jgi:putative FmdB family regulatory protein
MPLYEFACVACDSKFERLLSFQAATTAGAACPSCGRGEARRLVSTFAALSKSGTGESRSVAGAGCACSTGGGCGCGCGH